MVLHRTRIHMQCLCYFGDGQPVCLQSQNLKCHFRKVWNFCKLVPQINRIAPCHLCCFRIQLFQPLYLDFLILRTHPLHLFQQLQCSGTFLTDDSDEVVRTDLPQRLQEVLLPGNTESASYNGSQHANLHPNIPAVIDFRIEFDLFQQGKRLLV